VVINIADMGNVRVEFRDHLANFFSGLGRIDGVQSQARLRGQVLTALEVGVGNKMVVVGRGLSTLVGHGEQRDFVSPRAHQFHGLKQVGFGPAEPEVVLVAIQDSHGSLFLSARVRTG
jgi:hypothetical protein